MSTSEQRQIDLVLARQYFLESKDLFSRDSGNLWGISLEGPLIFVDYETRQAVANQPDQEGQLTCWGDLWIGLIPPEVIVANTAAKWAGVHWTMVIWQAISPDTVWRAEFFAHEAFHLIQAEIGLPMPEIPNANTHLDSFEGRYWLQLEWRALERSLAEQPQDRSQAIEDALLFRATRRSLFPLAAAEEQAMEMHEGLAEYTGFRLSQMTCLQAAEYVRSAPGRYPSFVRSFAYASGPAYGLLLDELLPTWREGLTRRHDFGVLLKTALSLTMPDTLMEIASERAQAYDGEALRQHKLGRDQEHQAQIAVYRLLLLDGPVLILPLSPEVRCTFDPRATVPIPGLGTVFPFVHVSDEWGVLNVDQGGLFMANDWKSAKIIAPADPFRQPATGDGWSLQLSDHWEICPAERPGDFKLAKQAIIID